MSSAGGMIGADLTKVGTTLLFELGTIFRNDDGKSYKYVQYSHEAAAVDGVAGEVCYYVADNGIMAHDVTSDLDASDEIGAGVLQAVMADNEYGWIQVKGPATLTIELTAEADGGPLTPTGSADGSLDLSAAVTDHVCAVAGDSSANEIYCLFPD